MRILYSLFFLCLPSIALAQGIKTNDIIGLSPGMSPDQVLAKITEYNPAMVVQKVMTVDAPDAPSYVLVISAAIPGKKPNDPPQDEISVRFARHADGSIVSNAVSHLVYPLPEDQRVLFKTFTEKLAVKYGPISNMNDRNTSEVRWIFNSEGAQKLSTLSSDMTEYQRCSTTSAYIPDSTTRAGLPENAVRGCGDFLYVRLYPVDTDHNDILGGYYMTYINQENYLNEIQGEIKGAAKDNIPEYKKMEEQKEELQKNNVPKF